MSVNKELKDYLKNSGEHSTIGQTLFPAKKRHKHDMKNIGLLKQNGKYYSIHDLPDGFVVRGDLDLSGMDLSDVNLNMEVMGTLVLSGEYKTILPPILDLSNMAYVDLHNTDLSGVREIKWPTTKIDLRSCRNLPQVLDFSGTTTVDLRCVDLSGVREIKGPTNRIDLMACNHLPPILDFGATKQVDLSHADLSGVREIKSPTSRIDLRSCKNLPPVLDFSGTKTVDLSFAVLSDVHEIKWPTDSIHLIACKKLPPVLDFRGTKNVKARNADLSGVSEIKRSVDLPGNLRKIYDLLWVKMFMAAKSKNTFKGIIQRNVANRHISKKR